MWRFILSSNSNNCCLLYFNANIMCIVSQKKLQLLGDFRPQTLNKLTFFMSPNNPVRSTTLVIARITETWPLTVRFNSFSSSTYRNYRNLSSRIDLHTHAGSALSTTAWPFDLRVNACWATAVHRMSTKFGVNSSSRFAFRARTHTQTHRHKITGATDYSTHASTTAGVDTFTHRGWL